MSTIFRFFNTYGPRQSARAVIPTIITQLAKGETVIKLGSLTPTRDFNYVKDTVGGFISALESKVGFGDVFNFGSNFEVSIGDTVKIISELMGVDVKIVTDDVRLRPDNSEVERLWADNSKAIKTLNWKPAYSGLDGFKRGLTETIEWFKNESNLASYKSNIYNI